jgi:E3 ubiquitin-protein ligase MGRN1
MYTDPIQMPPNVIATRQHNTTTIHNLVNLQPTSLRIIQDERNKATYHIQFDFDAKVACHVTIYYTGSSRISPETKKVVVSTEGPLQSNMRLGFPAGNKQFFDGQLFRSEALNTSVYGASDLIHKKGTSIFPVIIVLSVNSEAVRALGGDPTIANGTRAQVTYATLVAKDDAYQLRCIKQDVIDPNGQNYEVSQIYGLKNQSTDGVAGETGECVICMTDPVTTVILPCRHMCLCSSCSISLKLQAGKCPICRGDASELLQINVKK